MELPTEARDLHIEMSELQEIPIRAMSEPQASEKPEAIHRSEP